MKNIGAFFLLFIVLISLLPCSDEEVCNETSSGTSFQIAHSDENANSENCAAICMCNCCGQRVMVVEQIQFSIKAPLQFSNHTVKDYQFHLEQLADNIWQPPKIA